MELINREEVEIMLRDTYELNSYSFRILDEKLEQIPTRVIMRDCDDCMGATFGDCQSCERFFVPEEK